MASVKFASRKRQTSKVSIIETIVAGPLYTFERWTLDCARGVLTSEGRELTLRPKSFDVLRFLIKNAGRLVSRDEVLAAVWPGLTSPTNR